MSERKLRHGVFLALNGTRVLPVTLAALVVEGHMRTIGWSERCFHSRRSRLSAAVLMLVLMLVAGAACDGDDDIVSPKGFRLTFSLDATFQALHGGDPISWALVQSSNGFAADFGGGVVSGTANPAFSFTTADVMQRGVDYEVHYWIDSNIGGGTLGVCDAETIDHQWSTELISVRNDINLTVPHNPSLVENVCSSFLP